MNADPARVLLVRSARPHPWALLRDRLDAHMVRVQWLRPDEADTPRRWWAAAAEGPATPPPLPWPALLWWVGEAGRPPGARPMEEWRRLAEAVEAALATELAGVRLAPTCGVSFRGAATTALPEVETLLAAAAGGIPYGPGDAGHVRRVRATLRRHRLPLELVAAQGVAHLRPQEPDVRPA